VITISNGVVLFKTEGRNSFTRATRQVATRAALQERGYDRDQVAEIMRRTIAHVGETDLSEGQWLGIAVRHAVDLKMVALPLVTKDSR